MNEEIVREVAGRDRHPVRCSCCGDVADGRLLLEALESGGV